MTEIKDIYWLAGLIEGEGCFTYNGKSPTVKVSMTDKDVVEKAHLILKAPINIFVDRRGIYGVKDTYVSYVSGSLAIQWMLTIYPLMGKRRKAKIKEVVAKWKSEHQTKAQYHLRRSFRFAVKRMAALRSANGYSR